MVSKALIAASTKPVILSILAGREIYGYHIIHSMIEISGGTLEWSEGTIYPVLHRMEKDGLIRSQWKISESGRRRKYYRLSSFKTSILSLSGRQDRIQNMGQGNQHHTSDHIEPQIGNVREKMAGQNC